MAIESETLISNWVQKKIGHLTLQRNHFPYELKPLRIGTKFRGQFVNPNTGESATDF